MATEDNLGKYNKVLIFNKQCSYRYILKIYIYEHSKNTTKIHIHSNRNTIQNENEMFRQNNGSIQKKNIIRKKIERNEDGFYGDNHNNV